MSSSYQESCKEISINGNVLSATCKKSDGSDNKTSIILNGIENIDGELKLNDPNKPSSYQKSCKEISINGNVLSATCKKSDGSDNKTSIVLNGIENIDGSLKQTSFITVEVIQKVIIYQDRDYQGSSQELEIGDYNTSNLQIGNDNLSSLKIPSGLKVTLYQDTDFRGSSKVFTQNTPYVEDSFNDKTSSIKVEAIAPTPKQPPSEQSSSQPVLVFDGKDDYINCGNGGIFKVLNLTETMTLECWVNLVRYNNTYIFAKQNQPGQPPIEKEAIFYGLFIDDAKKIPKFIYSTKDQKNQELSEAWNTKTAEIALNRWYHLAVVVNNQQVELFVNGKSQGASKLEGKIADNADAELLIGKRYPNDSLLAGQLADLRVWKKARTAAEIQANFSQRLAYNEPELVAYWPLNKGSGTVAYDTTRADNYGIIYGGATWGTSELPIAPLNRKDQFPYADKIGDISRFDPDKVLPAEVQPTDRWLANFHQLFKGLGAASFPLLAKGKSPLPFMPANLTRLRPDKFSDEFFVDRRLNGFNPGQLKRVENQLWQYVILYDFSKVEVESVSSIFPKTIEARFCLDGQMLHLHSIEYTLHNTTKIQTHRPGDQDWERAKKIFRCADFVYHESRTHLGRTHFNIDQYAIAYYRNIVNNPIKKLLEPHFENTININQRGATEILGYKNKSNVDIDGLIPGNSSFDLNNITLLIKEELSNLTYRNWTPLKQTLSNYVVNNHFDQAAIAMWAIINDYVSRFFTKNYSGIQEHWAEIEGMSVDLSSHSILKRELGTLDIKTMKDLQELCVFVIYISSFFHSWVNNKQFEDGGDTDYVTMGMWESADPITEKKLEAKQVTTLWNLSHVRYNLIMDVGPAELKDAVWKQRHLIEPGLPLDRLLMSISI